METVFETHTSVVPSLADAEGRLGIPSVFAMFMDAATLHAEALSVGPSAMTAKQLFWLTVKTQIRFFSRPQLLKPLTVRTWPEAPGKVRAMRSYQLCAGDRVLAAGKTEWAVMNTATGQLAPLEGLFPAELRFDTPTACPEPFARIPDAGDWESYGEHRVCSTDIDLGGHMNNVAYIRALLSGFSNRELRKLNIARMDAVFRSPCFEGETLTLQQRPSETGLHLRIAKADGTTALLAAVETGAK